MTAATTLGAFYGGPDDGGTKALDADDLVCGFIDTQDSFGNTYRYSILPFVPAYERPEGLVTHKLIPSEVL